MAEDPPDVIVVGSGLAGGWVAKELTEAGLHTLVLEAGPARSPADVPARLGPDATPGSSRIETHAAGPDAPRSQHVQRLHPLYRERGPHLFVDDSEHPYETPEGKPFHWIRGMQVGGRSLLWGGTALRLSPAELDARPRDGGSAGWPLRYEELAPFYSEVEAHLGLVGRAEGHPGLPDGVFARGPYATTPAEEAFRRTFVGRGTRAIDVRFISGDEGHDGWPRFTSQGSTLAMAQRTGRLTVRPRSVVTSVTVARGAARASGVRFVDARSLEPFELAARVVFLCAGTISTARILLNSATPQHPNGLANSSGLVGRCLMDHPCVSCRGVLPGYPIVEGYEVSARQRGLVIPPAPAASRPHDDVRPFGLWVSLQRASLRDQPLGVISAQGEMLPSPTNRVRLSQSRDRWGVPLPVIECAYGEHERALYHSMIRAMREVCAAAGVEILRMSKTLSPPGLNVHEVGTARMGADPTTSVLDAHNQCWDCDNLFVVDGACFPSCGWQNPSLTIMALAARAGRHAARRLAEGAWPAS